MRSSKKQNTQQTPYISRHNSFAVGVFTSGRASLLETRSSDVTCIKISGSPYRTRSFPGRSLSARTPPEVRGRIEIQRDTYSAPVPYRRVRVEYRIPTRVDASRDPTCIRGRKKCQRRHGNARVTLADLISSRAAGFSRKCHALESGLCVCLYT